MRKTGQTGAFKICFALIFLEIVEVYRKKHANRFIKALIKRYPNWKPNICQQSWFLLKSPTSGFYLAITEESIYVRVAHNGG